MYNTEFAVALLQQGDNIAGLQFLCIYKKKKIKLRPNPKTRSKYKKIKNKYMRNLE